jgi:uncharacterized Zn finger protein/DNA-binding XRE family transcriptional regulator
MRWGHDGGFPRYVRAAELRKKAGKQAEKLRKQGRAIEPVAIEGRAIAGSVWGKGWCKHLESFSDYENRLPRGRAYVRNGSVCHLEIYQGRIEALVSGSRMYTVNIEIRTLKPAAWRSIKARCAGEVGSMLELLQGRLSNEVMAVVTDRETGLFPRPGEISFDCSCPDWATMCKHVAAVLYGVGNRLDGRPGLLFTLRGVDADELIAEELALPAASGTDAPTLSEDHIGSIFGIELDAPVSPAPSPGKPPPRLRPTGKSVARLRRQSGDTIAEFARRLGVSSSTVYRWESTEGRLKLKPRILEALAGLSRKA